MRREIILLSTTLIAVFAALTFAWLQILPEAPYNTNIAPILNAYGGAGPLGNLGTYELKGRLDSPARGLSATWSRLSQSENDLEVNVRYPDHTEMRRLTDGEGWSGSDSDTLDPVSWPQFLAMTAQAARARLPGLLGSRRHSVLTIMEDDHVAVLEVPLDHGILIRLQIERPSHHIVRSETLITLPEGRIGFATDYSDFRMVDGVLIPFREESWAQGVHTASIFVEGVEFESGN